MSNDQNNEIAEMIQDMDIDVDTAVEPNNPLDLNALGHQLLEELKGFKSNRNLMITKRAALKRAIKITDKRIEMILEQVKVLQRPN